MSLATRCPACGTTFRVVQDQLKVSQGWVRCGRCAEVFNALETLFDIGDAAASAPAPASAEAGRVLEELARHTQPGALDGDARTAPPPAPPMRLEDPPEPYLMPPRGSVAAASATVPKAPAAPPPAPTPSAEPSSLPPDSTTDSDISVLPADAPAFLQQAERAARWQRPGVRIALSLGCVLLAGLAAAQAAIAWRDPLAAHQPALQPLLAALCQPLGCRVEPLRRIDRLAVESSGLTRVEGAPLYRLSVVLRSRADTAVRLPAIDLQLSDAQGATVARRVLQPAELGVAGTTIAAGQELPMQALLSAGDKRLSGYTVEIFYP